MSTKFSINSPERGNQALKEWKASTLAAICLNNLCRKPKIKAKVDIGVFCPHCQNALYYQRMKKGEKFKKETMQ
jgi:hypothetical protein